MQSNDQSADAKRLWTGRAMTGLSALFMIIDGAMKLFKPSFVVEATTQLGFPESVIVGLGIVLLLSTALYLAPPTEVLGAVLLTGYLGGAIAAKVRLGAPTFDLAFALALGALVWGGLYLRDPRLADLFPWRRAD
jgi:DoxX-like family